MSEKMERYTRSTSASNAIDDVAAGESWDQLDSMRRFPATPGHKNIVTVTRIETEPAIAAFSEALLRPEVVEAAAKVLKGWDMYSHQSSEHFEKDATEVLTAIVAAIGAEGERSGY